MNYAQPGSEIRQSDEILRKLNQIKHAIEDHRESSPDNLHQYLPKERLNSNPYNKSRRNDTSNPQSYRQSLEKKLQRLFKEQKKVFNDKQERLQPSGESIHNLQTFVKYQTKDAFTVEKMQNKIKELERKYLASSIASQQKVRTAKPSKQKDSFYQNKIIEKNRKPAKYQQENQGSYKKNKSTIEKYEPPRQKQIKVQKKEKIEEKSDQRLLTDICSLKREIRQIKESNLALNQRIELKQNEKRYKKQRSRYLLSCILTKLIEIQDQVGRREKKQERKHSKQTPVKGSLEERQQLIHENAVLIRQVQQLGKNLKKQMAERQRAQQRTNWIEGELRKLNRI